MLKFIKKIKKAQKAIHSHSNSTKKSHKTEEIKKAVQFGLFSVISIHPSCALFPYDDDKRPGNTP